MTVLAGQPIAVTYNPLCQSLVVLDRTVGEHALEFGTSGLMFILRTVALRPCGTTGTGKVPACPLQGRATIAGPAAGTKRWGILPFELATWTDWKTRHPQTRIMGPNPAAEQRFDHLSYAAYLNNDELKFPVKPEWDSTNCHRARRR